ncbi:large ribosomal subunit protein mL49 [Macrobrachium rosenbergii]|uniref:large ribosomal subunit protein mL49 n=1 Tax=Macrobrachium rosenbergii TaxID=79674 RepID=UPI0034D74724
MNTLAIGLRALTRSRLERGIRRDLHTSSIICGIQKLPRGHHSIPESREKVEISVAEWPFVERVLPLTKIPTPTAKPGEVMPSGWVAPSAKPGDCSYYINRNANHMLPVYIIHQPIMSRFFTIIRHVEGDIFALGEEVRKVVSETNPQKHAVLQVNESQRWIKVKGNHYQALKDFLLSRGF